MKIEEILKSYKVGDVITDKRVLCALQRRGLIWGYSRWGYLESKFVRYRDEDGSINDHYYEYFPNENAQEDPMKLYGSFDEMCDSIGKQCGFWYKGYRFDTKYLDGCFQPYLYLAPKPGEKMEVNRRMSVFGTII